MTDWGRMLDSQCNEPKCQRCGRGSADVNGTCLDCEYTEAMAEREDEINEPSVFDYCDECGGLPNECECGNQYRRDWDGL